MSLDVYLSEPRSEPLEVERACELLRQHGFDQFAIQLEERNEHGPIEHYSANITHNLGRMAREAGIYEYLWRPEETGARKARQLQEPLREGLQRLKARPEHFKQFDAPNGWGLHEHLVQFVQDYLDACLKHPDADISVSR